MGAASKGPEFPLGEISLDFESQCAKIGVGLGIFVGSEVGCWCISTHGHTGLSLSHI